MCLQFQGAIFSITVILHTSLVVVFIAVVFYSLHCFSMQKKWHSRCCVKATSEKGINDRSVFVKRKMKFKMAYSF